MNSRLALQEVDRNTIKQLEDHSKYTLGCQALDRQQASQEQLLNEQRERHQFISQMLCQCETTMARLQSLIVQIQNEAGMLNEDIIAQHQHISIDVQHSEDLQQLLTIESQFNAEFAMMQQNFVGWKRSIVFQVAKVTQPGYKQTKSLVLSMSDTELERFLLGNQEMLAQVQILTEQKISFYQPQLDSIYERKEQLESTEAQINLRRNTVDNLLVPSLNSCLHAVDNVKQTLQLATTAYQKLKGKLPDLDQIQDSIQGLQHDRLQLSREFQKQGCDQEDDTEIQRLRKVILNQLWVEPKAKKVQRSSDESSGYTDVLLEMVRGTVFYKSFESRQTLKTLKHFDPLSDSTPDQFGYGPRLFQLDPNRGMILVKQSLRKPIEFQCLVDRVLKPALSPVSQDILREQKNYKSKTNDRCDQLEEAFVTRESPAYKAKCAKANFIPFSFVTEDKRFELLATSVQSLEVWLVGLQYLAQNRKNLEPLWQSICNQN